MENKFCKICRGRYTHLAATEVTAPALSSSNITTPTAVHSTKRNRLMPILAKRRYATSYPPTKLSITSIFISIILFLSGAYPLSYELSSKNGGFTSDMFVSYGPKKFCHDFCSTLYIVKKMVILAHLPDGLFHGTKNPPIGYSAPQHLLRNIPRLSNPMKRESASVVLEDEERQEMRFFSPRPQRILAHPFDPELLDTSPRPHTSSRC